MVEEINSTTTAAYHFQYDGNGNVTEITDHTGASAATYRYDAFGNTLVATGNYAATNRYRFSTKPLDNEIANAPLYYYAYRYYDQVTGRWPARDPIEEEGGINLYGFVYNNPNDWIDYLGWNPLAPQSEIDNHGYRRSMEARNKTRDSHNEVGGDRRYYRREYCGIICCKGGETKSTNPHGGTRPTWKRDKSGMQQTGQSTCDPFFDVDKQKAVTCEGEFGSGWKLVAGYHSHTKSEVFSTNRPGENIATDQDWAETHGNLYLGSPSGNVSRMDGDGNITQIPEPNN
jgi:RHS repeat-associated protein